MRRLTGSIPSLLLVIVLLAACSAHVPQISPTQPLPQVYWESDLCWIASESEYVHLELDDSTAAYFRQGILQSMRLDRHWVRPPSIARGSYRYDSRDFEDWGHTIVEYRPDGAYVWSLSQDEKKVLVGSTDQFCSTEG